MGIKEKFVRRKLAKLTKDIPRKPVLPYINKVKVIGVIWQPSQKEAYNYLRNYFNREHVIFRGFCVFEETLNPHPDTSSLTVRDLNWWGLPKPDMIDDFTNMKFDVLLNIALKQNLVLDYITLISKARFKVGWSPNDNNYFDLNINIGEKLDAMYLAKQQIFYLAQLNKTTTE